MFTERRFNTGNVELNFAEGPSNGNALVMLHGISNWWRHFLPIMPALCFRHHIHALDFRGCGHSGRMPGAYSIADYAADVIAFIEKNFTEPVDLLGHSLGAHVSLVVANAIPKHIRSVILEDLPVWTADGRLQGRPFSQYSRLGVISWGRPKISTKSIICLAKVNIPEISSVIAFGLDPWPCWKQMFLMPTFCPIPVWDMIRKL